MTSDSPIDISREQRGSWTIVRIQGDVDIATAPSVEGLSGDCSGLLAADLSQVRFIDSSGLRALLQLHETREGFVLVSPSGVVRRLLSLTKLSGVFKIVDDVDALEAV